MKTQIPFKISLFLITGLVLYIFFMQRCSCNKKVIQIECDTIYLIDTINIEKKFPVYIPKPYFVKLPADTIILSIPYKDSSYCKAMAIAFFSRKEYRDTIPGDSIEIYLQHFVYRNNIDSVKATVKVKIPYVKTVVMPFENKNKFFICSNIGTDFNGFSFGPSLIVTDKKDFLYKAGVDFLFDGQKITPFYGLGFGFKISFKKKQ